MPVVEIHLRILRVGSLDQGVKCLNIIALNGGDKLYRFRASHGVVSSYWVNVSLLYRKNLKKVLSKLGFRVLFVAQ